MTWSLAVDLGTSNTVAAVQRGTSAPVALTFAGGAESLPSMVYLAPGSVYVGDAAAEHAHEDPVAFHPSPKRELTGAGSDTAAQSLVPVLAALFREVYRTAAGLYGPEAPERVVLTHPEALPPTAQEILRKAAVSAGIPDGAVALVSEPVAAADYYCRGVEVPERLLVVDIGGGTTDVALLDFSRAGRPRIRAAAGDNSVGGRSFDHRLTLDVAALLDEGAPEPETLRELGKPETAAKLRAAREQLSTSTAVDIELTESDETMPYSRERLVQVTAGELDRIVTLVTRILGSPDGVTGLDAVLTGGISLMPEVQERLGDLTSLRVVENPHSAVALGALLTDDGGQSAVETAADVPLPRTQQRPRKLRRPVVVAMTLFLVVALVAGGLFLGGRGNDETGESDAPDEQADVAADLEAFDPSPVVPVRVSENSPVLNASVPGWLTCSALAEAVFDEFAGADNPHAVRPSNSVPGEIMTCSLNGSGLVGTGDIMLMTRPPERFDAFRKYRSGNARLELSTPWRDYPQWYRLKEEKLIGASENSFVYIEGHGWLIISLSQQKDIDDRVADRIIEIITPLLEIEE